MPRDSELYRKLEHAQTTIRGLQEELAETNRGLIALMLELEQRVEERTAELLVVNQELEAFAYSVSHDLRAPLRSIAGFSQAVLEDYQDRLDAAGAAYLQQIIAASQHMAQLIDDLLGLSRVTRATFRRQPSDLGALARVILADLCKSEPERNITYEIADELIVQADERLLRILLTNLLGNAWKFTRHQPAAHIEVGAIAHDHGQAFFVRDNGAGFDMAYAGKLFGAFQRLHSTDEYEG